jgi:DNA polymerase III subunit gamma/tau
VALALYRKYRPRTFAEVIGQEHVTEPLSQALRSGRLHHAYLFSGPRGCGKTSSARILARSLNCEQGPTPEPCGVCASCRSLANDGVGSIDVIEIDAASHGGVDDARDLREKAFFAPAGSRYKIYVIDEAHMVSSAGFNALLKLVEEPPDYVKFIFATTEPEKVLGTIRSRTHHYPFRLIPPAVLRPYLQQLTEAEGVHVEPAVFPLVVRAGGGSARDSLSVLDQLIAGAGPEGVSYARAVALLGVTDVALIDEMCDALAAGDGAAAYATIDRVAEAGHDPRRFASDLLERLRDLIVLQQVPDAVAKGLIDGPADQLDAMGAQATRLGPATLSRCADIVHNGLIEMRGTTAPRLLLELITARMLLPGAEDSTGALLQRLERMERRLTLSADQDPVRAEPTTPSPAETAGEVTAPAQPGGGGGISAARAAAAAAGRRAPAAQQGDPTPSPGMTDGPAPTAGDRSTAAGAAAVPGGEPTGRRHGMAAPRPEQNPVAARSTGDDGHSAPSARPDADAGSAPAPAEGSSSTAPARGESSAAEGSSSAASVGAGVSAASVGAGVGAVAAEGGSSPAVRAAQEPAAQRGAQVRTPHQGAGAPPQARRPEPAGVLPDAPEDQPAPAGATGQLSAAAIREVWPEIMTAVGRRSKKIAALAQGATVRDVDGQTVVLTFRFPAHAKMVAAEPSLLSDALYEALGGRWQIRCDVAGEAGPSQGSPSARTAPGQPGAARAGSGPAAGRSAGAPNAAPAQARSVPPAAPARQRESTPQPAASDDGDDWPEPVRPGGAAAATGGDPHGAARPGGSDTDHGQGGAAADGGVAGAGAAAGHGAAGGGGGGSAPADRAALSGGGIAAPDPGPADGGVSVTAPGTTSGDAVRTGPAGSGPGGSGPGGSGPASGVPGGSRPAGSASGAGVPGSAASRSGGLAAARAAAAGAARAGAGGRDGAAARNTGGASTSSGWSDGSSAAEEPPYDPEYDGPVRGGGAAYEGFDPGDEPLDEVIDEKTARQSSEQQAVKLLQDAFGAEKISEL